MKETIIAIDNGISGSIAIFFDGLYSFHLTPVRKELSYTKQKQFITRIDINRLKVIFSAFTLTVESKNNFNVKVYLERPMINPMRWKASVSAIRALEATLIIIEQMRFSLNYVDSREWQKGMLPKGLEKGELKKASCDIASRLFPKYKKEIEKHGDGDSLLMGEYFRRKNI